MLMELKIRSHELTKSLGTIYFGGGTPSVLQIDEIGKLLKSVADNFEIVIDPEITLEANPEDLNPNYLDGLLNIGINRLSVGLQTFDNEDLIRMNRSHSSEEAIAVIDQMKKSGFQNFSVDLIYGFSNRGKEDWAEQIQRIIELDSPHISVYGLTIERKTVLQHWVNQGKFVIMEEDTQAEFYEATHKFLSAAGYEHYEVSNYSKPGYRSKHNQSYWLQRPYLGIGPSAHSYDGDKTRKSNVYSNAEYLRKLGSGQTAYVTENLSRSSQINEYILTRSRTVLGIETDYLSKKFKIDLISDKEVDINLLIENGYVVLKDNVLFTTNDGLLVADEIAFKLFYDEDIN